MSTHLRVSIPIIALVAGAASAEDVPDLYKLVTPDAPASVILGVSPSEIQRPTDPNALAFSLLNAASAERLGRIPGGLSVEAAPYWLVTHPQLTFEEYERSGWRALYRKMTLSLATASAGDDRQLALGFRTRILDGEPAARSEVCQAALTAAATRLSEGVSRFLAEHPAASADELHQEETRLGKEARARLAAELEAAQCQILASARRGLTIDAAGAAALQFPGGEVVDGRLTSFALWVTLSYLGEHASLLALARLEGKEDGSTPAAFLDLGGRATWADGAYGASFEWIYRRSLRIGAGPPSYKVSFSLEYRLREGMWIGLTGGKGFAPGPQPALFGVVDLKLTAAEERRVRSQ